MKYKIIRTNRKTLALQVKEGQIIVRSPLNVSEEAIDIFVKKKESWLKKHIEMYEPLGYHHNISKQLRVFGVLKKIIVRDNKRLYIEEDDFHITVFAPSAVSDERVNRFVDNHYKEILNSKLKFLVTFYSWRLNLKTPNYIIRRYKNLYGRCNSANELAFNVFLYHDTIEFIHYVVLHECAHIIEFNHSAKFYSHIERIMPQYKEIINSNKSLRLTDQDL